MENKDNFRLDAFRVKKKVFKKYAPGSPERKRILKESKLNEISFTSNVLKNFPKESLDVLEKVNKEFLFGVGIKTLWQVLILAGAISIQISHFHVLSILESFSLGGAEAYLTIEVFSAINNTVRLLYTFRKVHVEYNRLQNKLEGLLAEMGDFD